ncbi:regulator [Streptomyces bathyalis]|uniref:Regulator n=1 Tax=Streptomyces bathyalis TaxID=2710756 RepID=A0A7T1WTK6_9ACTN|nr:regulator [Streptomyces bathyalis]
MGALDTVATLEAFADTMVPGEKRHRHDRAVAGAAPGPGAVHAGAVTLLQLPELGVGVLLPELAALLNTEATAWALARGHVLLPSQPPFVALDFEDRTHLAGKLLSSAGLHQKVYVLLALFSAAAFDTAAHLHTTDALDKRHPGLTWLRFPAPGTDGFWRYPTYSYGKRLAHEHPHTTAGGHPA